MREKFVKIISYGEVTSHLPDVTGNYETLCGMDGNDHHKSSTQEIVGTGEKVNCPQCFAIWKSVQMYKLSNFSNEVSR